MRKKNKNEDDVKPGTNAWRSLPHAKRAEIRAKRLGGEIAKKLTPEEAASHGFDEVDPEAEAHIPKGPPRQLSSYKAKVRMPRLEELSPNASRKLRENIEGSMPNDEYVNRDDTAPGDRSVFDRGAVVTKVRELDGHQIERRNPYGHWYIIGLENELGSYIGLKEAQDSLIAYLKRHQNG